MTMPPERKEYGWPNGCRAAAAITVDVDGESGVLCDSPQAGSRLSIMAHQAYGPAVGLPRILRILHSLDLRATFFVPGLTAELHGDAIRAVADAGHEIGHHGYAHELVTGLTEDEEESVLTRGLEALARVADVRPAGWRAPMFELNYRTPALLARHGFSYDSSLMDSDRPYVLARGTEAAGPLVEVPVQWALEDGVQYGWLPGIWESGSIESPLKVLEMWLLEFDAMVNEGGCFVLTVHPYLSGRPGRAEVLRRLLTHMLAAPGVWIATTGEIAAYVATLGLPAQQRVEASALAPPAVTAR
jgi:peptidoglycan/xylan/chitin deacetylase (PgdA/CDA1 family)